MVAALLWSRPADAQVTIDPGPPREPGGLWNNLATGVQNYLVNQALAERPLEHFQAKLSRDTARGNSAAVGRDVRRMYGLHIASWSTNG